VLLMVYALIAILRLVNSPLYFWRRTNKWLRGNN
jgi:hypothetical protein